MPRAQITQHRGLQPKHPHTVPVPCRRSTHAHLVSSSFLAAWIHHFYNMLIKAAHQLTPVWFYTLINLSIAYVLWTNLNPLTCCYQLWLLLYSNSLSSLFSFVLLLLSVSSVHIHFLFFTHVAIHNVTGSVLCMLPSGAIGRSAITMQYICVGGAAALLNDWFINWMTKWPYCLACFIQSTKNHVCIT